MQQGTGVCFVQPELESRTGSVRVDARAPQGISPGSSTRRLHAAQHALSLQSCGEQPHGFGTGVPLVQEKGSEPSLVSPEEAGRGVDNIKNCPLFLFFSDSQSAAFQNPPAPQAIPQPNQPPEASSSTLPNSRLPRAIPRSNHYKTLTFQVFDFPVFLFDYLTTLHAS
jgi:hypothetical protein